jgi:hypothetical protein
MPKVGQSKSDQLRALREHAAALGRPLVVDAVMPAVAPRRKLAPTTKIDVDVPWLAPDGHCASCDKRRAALQAAMRRRRAKTAPPAP